MTERLDPNELPSILRWDPHWAADPVPEWWLRGLESRLVAEIVAIRLDTARKMLAAQAEGLEQAANVIRSQG